MTDKTIQDELAKLLIRGIEVLTIADGDCVVIRSDENTFDAGMAGALANQINAFTKARGLKDVHFLLVPSNLDIKALNREEMKQQGWVRAGFIIGAGH